MREILFKAKQIDNGEWIEGSLIDLDIDSGYCYIVQPYKRASILPIIFLITDRMKLVDPETLCQFTGLTDKNGNKIWENDVIQYGTVAAVTKFGEYGNGGLGFYVDFPEETNYRKDFSYWAKKVVVIGNAVDDRNLLQEVPE